MSRVRIVATIGPRTNNTDALRKLEAAGMNLARLNGSHSDLGWHERTIKLIRKIIPQVPILLDIPGRKIRTGILSCEPKFGIGDIVILTTDPDYTGEEKVTVNNPDLHRALKPGDAILGDDGALRFTVDHVDRLDIYCRAENEGTLQSSKGINVPHVKLPTQIMTRRDAEMIKFAREHSVDFIGISFVDSPEQISAIRTLIGGKAPRIVSKIENQAGLDRVDDIVEASDAIMIDRGDLSVETNLEHMALFQKKIIAVAREKATPVIVATEMLHTMIKNPRPTKAEVSDISNAVLDGASALMLSGETAIGAFPYESVCVMRSVSEAAETFLQESIGVGPDPKAGAPYQVMGQAISLVCRCMPITKIVAVTISGFAARSVASRLPRQPILAVTNDPNAARAFNLIPGTKGVYVDIPFSKKNMEHIPTCLKALWKKREILEDDLILVTAVAYPNSGNRMNLVETHYVSDLVQALGWKSNE